MAHIAITEFCKIHQETSTLVDQDVSGWADASLYVAAQLIHAEDASPEDIIKSYDCWLSGKGEKDVTVQLDSPDTAWTYSYTV